MPLLPPSIIDTCTQCAPFLSFSLLSSFLLSSFLLSSFLLSSFLLSSFLHLVLRTGTLRPRRLRFLCSCCCCCCYCCCCCCCCASIPPYLIHLLLLILLIYTCILFEMISWRDIATDFLSVCLFLWRGGGSGGVGG